MPGSSSFRERHLKMASSSPPVGGPAPSLPTAGAPGLTPRPIATVLPYSISPGTVLLFENFSGHRDNEAIDWGRGVTVRTGPDQHKWLVPFAEGVHPVGRSMALPDEFYFQCRYFAGVPEVTQGVLGWWKEPISSRITFVNNQGARCSIEWVIRCGSDPMRPNPLGSSSLFAKKYCHNIKLPDGTAGEVTVPLPTGVLRVERANGSIKVLLDGQAAVAGTPGQAGQFVGFEINLVKGKNGTLSFTDFKIGH
jgi:hypothetical protein